MFQAHHAFFDISQSSSPISGVPRSCTRPPLPSLFTATGDREDYDNHHSHHQPPDISEIDYQASQRFLLAGDRSHKIVSTSAPENSTYDGLPPLSPITISMSPAAMFLSAFSPSVSVAPLPDDEGEEVDGYKLGAIIGYGGFSTIRRAFSPSGGTVAVKIVRRSDLASQTNSSQARDRLENEATIWKMLSHEHILPLFHFVRTPHADFFFMLLCPAGTLYDILKRDGRPALTLDDAGTMFRQVVRGVRYLHEQMGLVHADLKLENVLVDEMGVCRIGDFGMTRSIWEETEEDLPMPQTAPHTALSQSSSVDTFRPIGQSALPRGRRSLRNTSHLSLLLHNNSRPRRRESTPISTQSCVQAPRPHAVYEFPPGSLPYAAPELLHTPTTENPYRPHPAQDIWALGVMLYALLTGGLPFVDSFEPRLTMKILHGAFEMPKNVGRGAELVLRGCLEAVITQRWTIADVDDVSWSVGWDADPNDSCTGTAAIELERIVNETPMRAQRPVSCSRDRAPSVTPRHDVASEDAVPELEDDGDFIRGSIARSTSSRSHSTGTGAFSPFTNACSELEMPPVAPEFTLPGILNRPSLDRRGRYAYKRSAYGRRSSTGPARSTSPSIEPISPTSADNTRGRKLDWLDVQPRPMVGLGLSSAPPKRAGSQPPRHSAPWTVPSRARASVGVSPALSVALSTPHCDGGFVLKTGVSSVRSRSVGHA